MESFRGWQTEDFSKFLPVGSGWLHAETKRLYKKKYEKTFSLEKKINPRVCGKT